MEIKSLIALGTAAIALAIGAESRYTPQGSFYRHVADARVGTILDLVGRAQGASGDYKDTLCRTLVVELNSVCSDAPGHPVCEDRDMYLEAAGC
jgi:hypothetical protein